MLQTRSPQGALYRIGRDTRPWAYPDWSRAATYRSGKHTFGNRFDDPNGEYRVLYASSQLRSCYAETLSPFRPDLGLLAELNQIEGENDFQDLGLIPDAWFDSRHVGVAEVEGRFAALYTGEWVAHLRSRLAPLCRELGLPDFDLSTLVQAQNRIITQTASSIVYDLGSFAGIYYTSRFGQELENWALFEFLAAFNPEAESRPVSKTDPELIAAMEILGLRV